MRYRPPDLPGLRRRLVQFVFNRKMVAAEIPLPKPTIVIADDYPAMLEKVSALLREDFDVVASVANGREAVDAVAKLKPDVVILDVAMPEMDGIHAAKLIQGPAHQDHFPLCRRRRRATRCFS